MSVNPLEDLSSTIDVQYEKVTGACNLRGIDEVCGAAIDERVQSEQCAAQAASARVSVFCEGKILGLCGAQITGELLDANGNVLCPINTTASELREQATPEMRNIRALVNDVFTSEPYDGR